MATTLQVSEKLLEALKARKLYEKETYEEVIWNLIEDTLPYLKKQKKRLTKQKKDIKAGRIYTHDEIKKELDL